MANYQVKKIDEMEAIYQGAFHRARAELGVESFGMQIIDFPPNNDLHPEHSHAEDGQEEVYLVLRGAGEIDVEGEPIALDPETVIRVGPGTKRKLRAGPDGMRVLALGGVPGKAYEAPDITQKGAPDPYAG
jgi:quercetin dioxygenase-like cupin family protein